jgi:hypothetical protein
MPFNLFDDLKRPGFHSSITTTFSVDPAFYDANVQYRLRAVGCQNNLLIADAAMLSQALEQLPEAFSHAGRKYLIEPIEGTGCFHPKMMIRYGKAKASFTLGSANATSAGWGSNRELVSSLDWSQSAETRDSAVHRRLIARAHDWLITQVSVTRNPDLTYKFDLLNSQAPWLASTDRGQGVEVFADGSLVDLMLSAPDASEPIGDRFLGNVEGNVERLVVISPYWDSDLKALRRVHAELGKPPLHIFMTLSDVAGARQSTFPIQALGSTLKPTFHPHGASGNHRFLHAKLLVAQTRKYDFLLFGSTNCTAGALGGLACPGLNHEAAIFRRLPRGTVEKTLWLDFSEIIRPKDISAPEKPEPSAAPPRFNPGRIERKDDRLYWSVPSGINPTGADLLIDDDRHPLIAGGEGRPHARLGGARSGSTIVARVALCDGRISRPVIVYEPNRLMAAAPSPLASGIKRKLDAVLNGESDLIDLARDVHLLFGDANPIIRSALRADRRGASVAAVAGEDFDTPEEFREALGLKADLMAGGLSHANNPALQLLLQIVLRGIVQLEDSETIDNDSSASAAALKTGEDQDDEGSDEEGDEGDDDQDGDAADAPPANGVRERRLVAQPVPREAFERNQRTLERAIERFEDHIGTVAKSRQDLDLDFVTRALFMIYLMLHGCSHRYSVDETEVEVLMPFSAIGTRRQDEGFLMRGARLISLIWGRRFTDGIMARIPLDRELENVPIPILTLVILSRWILAAILVEARAAAGAKSLTAILESQIPEFYRSTSAFAFTNGPQVEAAVTQMARHIGMSDTQAQNVRKGMAELEKVMP